MAEAMDATEAMHELARLPERATAASCFGSAVSAGERTVIPVAELSYGFGFGWGSGGPAEERGAGGGGGAGGRARGVAVIEVAPEGVRIYPVQDQTALALAGITFATAAVGTVSKTLLKLIRG